VWSPSLSLARLFDIYEREATLFKSAGKQQHDRRAAEAIDGPRRLENAGLGGSLPEAHDRAAPREPSHPSGPSVEAGTQPTVTTDSFIPEVRCRTPHRGRKPKWGTKY